MSIEKNSFYVTTPIYYVTAKPHLGHLYSTVIADVLARWYKLQNYETFFLTGTDEFGQKIAQAAEKAGKQPQEFVDSFIDAYKSVWKDFNIDYNIFMRTTNKFHIKAVQDWIVQLMKQGDIYKSYYTGWYCTHCETFVTELENSSIAPNCPTCGRTTQRLSEEAYFFKLSSYQQRLLDFYQQHPDFIIPKERAQEVINFVKSGLKDLSISRTTVKWGVPFPNDALHVTYVWADALNNYITAIGWGQKGKEQEFNKWWPADVQVMGKDILRFHAIYWPAFLMATGLALPHHLLVHGWFKVGEQKMSKSFGNVIDPVTLFNAYGADPVRYYLLRQMAVTHDGEFSIQDLEQRISSDLADDLGNLLNRMVALCQKHGINTLVSPAQWSPASLQLYQESLSAIKEYTAEMKACMFHLALTRLWKFINQTNAYFHTQEPWKVAQTDKQKFAEIVSATAHALHTIGLLAWPVMPVKMEQLLNSLGVTLNFTDDHVTLLLQSPWHTTFTIKKIDNLFIKPEEPTIKPEETAMTEKVTEKTTNEIAIEEFLKVDLRVGLIEQCDVIEQSDKLYKLRVNFGDLGTRQILSGIRKFFNTDELIGKKALFVVNLKPRKMLGMESQGMLLTAQTADGKLSLLMPSPSVVPGTQLK